MEKYFSPETILHVVELEGMLCSSNDIPMKTAPMSIQVEDWDEGETLVIDFDDDSF